MRHLVILILLHIADGAIKIVSALPNVPPGTSFVHKLRLMSRRLDTTLKIEHEGSIFRVVSD